MEDNTKSAEQLKRLFNLTSLEERETIPERFEKIAKELFENYVIEADNKYYHFIDIEFYYSAPGHPDYITHPRNGEALHWYINDFGGIDINFESNATKCYKDENGGKCDKYVWDEKAHYGGILIRQLELTTEGENILLDGPLKVAELFRDFDALDGISKCPQLIKRNKEGECPNPCVRHGLVKYENGQFNYEKKLAYIQSWFKDTKDLKSEENIKEFHYQVNRKYRYCYSKFNKNKRESGGNYYTIPTPMETIEQ